MKHSTGIHQENDVKEEEEVEFDEPPKEPGEGGGFAVLSSGGAELDDAIGGNAYYAGRIELELPLPASARELGLRPSIFTDVGALWKVDFDPANDLESNLTENPFDTDFVEDFKGDSPSPRLSVGAGVSWNSPFGPFRVDFSKVLLREDGDDIKEFQFNIGGQF